MPKKLRKAIIICGWLLLWQLLAMWVDNAILMVAPFEVIKALAELLPQVYFWQTIVISLFRIGAGFLFGCAAGLGLAVAASKFSLLEEILEPVMGLLKTAPVASFVVLLLIWWGSSGLAVSICFLVVLPQIYISTLEGIKNTDKNLLEMAAVFHMPFWNRFFYIYRPALRPFIESSLKISLGMCWKSGVAAEVIGTPAFSIGEKLYMSKIYLDTAGVFAWTAVILLCSVVFERGVMHLANRFLKWEPACRKAKFTRKQGSIICRAVCKSYGEKKVIDRLDAVYEPGVRYELRTPSGSGKTTLLRLLCGLEQADSGSLTRQENCSMVFQEDRLCEDYSAVRNVELVTGDKEQARKALQVLLEADDLDKPCRSLSGGMKRRVSLVRALEAASDVLLLDEPFTGMDVLTCRRAQNYIQERQNGRTLLIATHI